MNTTEFTDDSFWSAIRKWGRKLGGEAMLMALSLWLVIRESDAPLWAKSTAAAALGYFISPVDAVPDFLPGGFADDVITLTMAVGVLSLYITDEIKKKARKLMPDWLRPA